MILCFFVSPPLLLVIFGTVCSPHPPVKLQPSLPAANLASRTDFRVSPTSASRMLTLTVAQWNTRQASSGSQDLSEFGSLDPHVQALQQIVVCEDFRIQVKSRCHPSPHHVRSCPVGKDISKSLVSTCLNPF